MWSAGRSEAARIRAGHCFARAASVVHRARDPAGRLHRRRGRDSRRAAFLARAVGRRVAISSYYFIAWLLVAAMVAHRAQHRPVRGSAARCARSPPTKRARRLRASTRSYKLLIFVISAGMASLGGSVIVHYLRVVDPTVFGLAVQPRHHHRGHHRRPLFRLGRCLGAGAIIAVREVLRLPGSRPGRSSSWASSPSWCCSAFARIVGAYRGPVRARPRHTGCVPQRRRALDVAPPAFRADSNADGPVLRQLQCRSFGALRAVESVSFDVNRATSSP